MANLIYKDDGKGKSYSHSFKLELDTYAELFIIGQGYTKKEALENFKSELEKLMYEINNEINAINWDVLVEGDDEPTTRYW